MLDRAASPGRHCRRVPNGLEFQRLLIAAPLVVVWRPPDCSCSSRWASGTQVRCRCVAMAEHVPMRPLPVHGRLRPVAWPGAVVRVDRSGPEGAVRIRQAGSGSLPATDSRHGPARALVCRARGRMLPAPCPMIPTCTSFAGMHVRVAVLRLVRDYGQR